MPSLKCFRVHLILLVKSKNCSCGDTFSVKGYLEKITILET